jgi:hypothetical protein
MVGSTAARVSHVSATEPSSESILICTRSIRDRVGSEDFLK